MAREASWRHRGSWSASNPRSAYGGAVPLRRFDRPRVPLKLNLVCEVTPSTVRIDPCPSTGRNCPSPTSSSTSAAPDTTRGCAEPRVRLSGTPMTTSTKRTRWTSRPMTSMIWTNRPMIMRAPAIRLPMTTSTGCPKISMTRTNTCRFRTGEGWARFLCWRAAAGF